MKKRPVMGKGKRTFWTLLRRLFVAVAAVILMVLACNSTITVETNGKVYRQNIAVGNGDSFENSVLFNEMLEEELNGLTRMVVIMSQLETDGSYNGAKEIDIAQYAHRDEEFPEIDISAPYLLDDLIKWGNFGFVTESVFGTQKELDAFFSSGSNPFALQNELIADRVIGDTTWSVSQKSGAAQEEQTLSMRMIEELPSSLEEYMRMAGELGKYVEEEDVLELHVLVPRYLSAQGKDLAEYANSVEEYIQLRDDLRDTSKDLFYNFREYSENRSRYVSSGTNLRFCYRMPVNGENCYFTNVEGNFKNKKIDEITQQFAGYGKYIYFNADRSEIITNTRISAEQMKAAVDSYRYVFGDNTRLWVAVNTSYPARDGFWTAKEAYGRLIPYYFYLAGALVIFLLLSLLLLAHLTRYEGRVQDPERGYTIRLSRADRIPTEPFLALGLAAMAAFAAAGYLGYSFCVSTWENALHSYWLPVLVGIFAFALDYVALFFYLSFIRRGKAHTLWKNSLFRRLLLWLKKSFFSLYDHSHILVRTLVPFVILLALNLILGGCGVTGILLASIFDVVAILVLYQEKKSLWEIVETTKQIGGGSFDKKVDARRMHGENRDLADAVNGIGDGIKTAVETSMKDERLKADLITNVSHDIKTPLTSIINFVNLLKREKIEDERVRGYIEVLDSKSQRLKQLTDDLVEASKISSGNISLQMERINFAELVNQTCGEFSDKFKERCLEIVRNMPDQPVFIEADSRRIWRVVENLFSNACKYALEGTRVYLEIRTILEDGRQYAVFSMKNISAQALNIRAEELTERFIRGDISRSTEGSGLGLSIARNLTELQKGRFEIYLDGDLFKVLLTFPTMEE